RRDCTSFSQLTFLDLIHLSLAGPIGGISYLILFNSYPEWPEVIPMKFVTTGTVINSLRQVFVNHCLPRAIMPRNVTKFSFTLFDDFCRDRNISLLVSG
ncbi:unnamed protein product, partial [Hymenolepis diminuta]